jgi:ribosomal-protein-serine acetyltransferase
MQGGAPTSSLIPAALNRAQAPATLELPTRWALSRGRALRALEEADVDDLYALIDANRERLAQWLPWAERETREGTLQFIRTSRVQIAQRRGFQAAVLERGRIVGVVGFHGIDWQHRSTSLGYWLSKHAEGRGVMSEAVRAMVDHALAVWHLNRVEIRASVENERSRALIERLGFRYEGAARLAFRLADGYHDDAVYAVLATEWPRAGAQP